MRTELVVLCLALLLNMLGASFDQPSNTHWKGKVTLIRNYYPITPGSQLFCRVQNPIVGIKRLTDGRMLGKSMQSVCKRPHVLPNMVINSNLQQVKFKYYHS